MEKIAKINKINEVVSAYFKANSFVNKIAAKELMPQLMNKGVFDTNHRDGLPLRDFLRELDAKNELHLIPQLFADRKKVNTYWYFIR